MQSNNSFLVKDGDQKKGNFGKRSMSMASPNMLYAMNRNQSAARTSEFGFENESQMRAFEALENYKTMLKNEGSSKHLLNKIQS